MGDSVQGRVRKDIAVNYISVRSQTGPVTDTSLPNIVAAKAVIDNLSVRKIFAIDNDPGTGDLTVGPATSSPNQIASFADETGAVLQASGALADSDGTISAVNLFAGPAPPDPLTATGGIQSDGTFLVAQDTTEAQWTLNANVDSVAWFRALRIGQVVHLIFSLQIGLAGISNGATIFTPPSGYEPLTPIVIVCSVNDGADTISPAEILLSQGVASTGILQLVGGLSSGDILSATVAYIAST